LVQASLAVNVLVKERLQPVVTIAPSLDVIVTVPQASVAVAVPSEPEGLDGLHPNATFAELPVKVGGVLSSVHVTVLEVVAVLLQASLAVNVLVSERSQTLLTTKPSDDVIVTAPHASVAVAVPSEPEGFAGLHPKAMVA
jgi:hypothetical protein